MSILYNGFSLPLSDLSDKRKEILTWLDGFFTSRVFPHRVKNISSPAEVRDGALQLYRHRLRGRRLLTQSNHRSVRTQFSILRSFPSDRETFNVQWISLFG